MKFVFVQTAIFKADWKRLKFDDESLRKLENDLAASPEAGATMANTGGVRKIRFASAGRGKSGACRVVYGYFPAYSQIHLLLAFGKNEQANLSAEEKSLCRMLMLEIATSLKDCES